jgi:hypothetical protein
MYLKNWKPLVAVLCLAPAVGRCQTIVYDSGGASYWGNGAYEIADFNNGNAALGTYIGASPAFEFVPSGIPNGDVLSSFRVPIGDGLFSGVYAFDLTLFTSGGSEDLNPQHWVRLGSWGGLTDGSFNSSSHTPVTVTTPPVTLSDGVHYYLMATVPANQGLDGSGNNYLDWGFVFQSGFAWEPLSNGYHDHPYQSGLVGAMQVVVSPGAPGVPEPGACALFASLGLTGAALLRRRRAR